MTLTKVQGLPSLLRAFARQNERFPVNSIAVVHYASRNVIFRADISAVNLVVLWQPYKFFCFVFGCAPHTENVVIIPLPN